MRFVLLPLMFVRFLNESSESTRLTQLPSFLYGRHIAAAAIAVTATTPTKLVVAVFPPDILPSSPQEPQETCKCMKICHPGGVRSSEEE